MHHRKEAEVDPMLGTNGTEMTSDRSMTRKIIDSHKGNTTHNMSNRNKNEAPRGETTEAEQEEDITKKIPKPGNDTRNMAEGQGALNDDTRQSSDVLEAQRDNAMMRKSETREHITPTEKAGAIEASTSMRTRTGNTHTTGRITWNILTRNIRK